MCALFGSSLMSFWGHFFTLLSGFEVHFGTCLVLGGSLGLPWGALGSSWAPGCPQEGLKERKVGSLEPPTGFPNEVILASSFFNGLDIKGIVLLFLWMSRSLSLSLA